MRSCYGVYIQPPPEAPGSCPPANPDEWQCFSPAQVQRPEVFALFPGGYATTQANAPALCGTYDATVATKEQLQDAFGQGAQWCGAAWVSDQLDAYYPMQVAKPECANGVGVQEYGASFLPKDPGTGAPMAGVNCYGKKPPAGTQDVSPFNSDTGLWYNPGAVPPGVSDSQVIVGREVAGNVWCATDGSNGSNCMSFQDMGSCQAFLATKPTLSGIQLNGLLGANIDQYVRDRV